MIPMLCPSCGRRGNVPPDKLNSTLHCKKCNTVFHLDLSGKVVLGEPPSAKKAAKKQQTEQAGDFDVIGAIANSILGLPKPVKILAGVLIVGGLGFFILQSMGGLGGSKKGGNSLAQKTYDAGESYVSQEYGDLRAEAAPGTEDDLKSWYDMMRPRIGDYGKQEPGQDVIVTPQMDPGGGEGGGGQTKTYATLYFPQKDGKMEDPGKVDFVWVKNEKGDWKLDGKAMLEQAKKAESEASAKGAGNKSGKR